MNSNNKRTLWIIVTAVMAIAFLLGGSRLTAFAREQQSRDDRVNRSNMEPVESLDDLSGRPGEFEFYGKIEAITETTWTVAGQALTILPGTELKGIFEVGDFVKVHAYPIQDGLAAREIEFAGAVVTETPGADDNSNESIDDNGNSSFDDGNGNSNSDDSNGNSSFDDDNGNEDNGNGNDDGDDDNGNGNDDNGNGDDNDDDDDD